MTPMGMTWEMWCSRISPDAKGDDVYVNEIKLDAIGFTDKAAIAETMNYVMRRVAEFSQK